jgi:hypothetical protein
MTRLTRRELRDDLMDELKDELADLIREACDTVESDPRPLSLPDRHWVIQNALENALGQYNQRFGPKSPPRGRQAGSSVPAPEPNCAINPVSL